MAVLIGCGSHSVSHKGKKGDSGTGGAAGSGPSGGTAGSGHSGGTAGTGQSGTSGTTEPGGGEGGEDGGGRGGSSPNGGRAGSVDTGGSAPGGSSSGGRGGRGGSGGRAGSGGASGAGGSGGRLPLPDGCVVQSGVENSSQCTLSATCNGTPNTALCYDSGSGISRCQCTVERTDRHFEIANAPGLASCAVAIGLCSQDELELGAETCSASGHGSLNDCFAGLTCGRPITVGFAPGVDASLMTYNQGACARDATGLPFTCNCETAEGHVEYGALAESGENVCEPLLEFCLSGSEPVFDGRAECFNLQEISDSSSCWLRQICAKPMRLTDDVRLARLEPRRSTCDSISSGSRCQCSTTEWYTRFDFNVSADPLPNTCTLAAANCDEDADIRPIGEPDCQPVSQNADTNSCDAIFDCPQPVTVDGRNILANGHITVACARGASGQPWQCACASTEETTAAFELGAASSNSWEACGLASAPCLDRIPVHIGAYGALVPPPLGAQ